MTAIRKRLSDDDLSKKLSGASMVLREETRVHFDMGDARETR